MSLLEFAALLAYVLSVVVFTTGDTLAAVYLALQAIFCLLAAGNRSLR